MVVDARDGRRGTRFPLPADIEDLQWNPHSPFQFAAACEDGTLLAHDIRKGAATLFRFKVGWVVGLGRNETEEGGWVGGWRKKAWCWWWSWWWLL